MGARQRDDDIATAHFDIEFVDRHERILGPYAARKKGRREAGPFTLVEGRQ